MRTSTLSRSRLAAVATVGLLSLTGSGVATASAETIELDGSTSEGHTAALYYDTGRQAITGYHFDYNCSGPTRSSQRKDHHVGTGAYDDEPRSFGAVQSSGAFAGAQNVTTYAYGDQGIYAPRPGYVTFRGRFTRVNGALVAHGKVRIVGAQCRSTWLTFKVRYAG